MPSGDVNNDKIEFSILNIAFKQGQTEVRFRYAEREQCLRRLAANSQLSIGRAAGLVAWNIDKFIVLVGHWAEPVLDELTELLEQEFSLPYFEFVYDSHWDHGPDWSGDMPK